MKKLTIQSNFQPAFQQIGGKSIDVSEPVTIVVTGSDDMTVSDGYHTMDELYEHRIVLFIALMRAIFIFDDSAHRSWCSKLHSDGTMFDGWFIAGIRTRKGQQITYHLPLRYWNDVINWAVAYDRAPEWDDHTSADVLKRLLEI